MKLRLKIERQDTGTYLSILWFDFYWVGKGWLKDFSIHSHEGWLWIGRLGLGIWI